MPQFDAETIVEPIRLKLIPYVEGFDWTTVTEPSDHLIGAFLAGLKQIYADAKKDGMAEDVDTSDPEQMAKALENLDPDKFVEFQSRMAALHADLCSGTPSQAQILAVPLRKRMVLFQWLQGEVLNPEVAPGGGNGAAS